MQRVIPNELGGSIRKWEFLYAPEANALTAEELQDAGITNATVADGGLQIVGIPVGSPAYIQETIRSKVIEHATPLNQLTSLALSDAQAALLIFMYCSVRRAHHLLQVIPYDAAPEEFKKLDNNLVSTFAKIVDIDLDELTAHPDSLRRLRQPWKNGGQGLPALADVADPALIAGWATIAPWLAKEFDRTLATIDPATGTHDAHLTAAWDRLQAKGDDVRGLLPTNIDDLIDSELKHLQRDITQAKDYIDFKHMRDRLATWGSNTKAEAAHLLSMAGPGATDWHAQCPFANHMKLTTPLIAIIVRAELYLPQPGLAFNAFSKCGACGAKLTEAHGHHAMCCKYNNEFISRTAWHNRIRDVCMDIHREAGLQASSKCEGLLGADELAPREQDRHKDKVADINFQGLRPHVLGVLADVSIVHNTRGTYPHTPDARAAVEEGAAVYDLEMKKMFKYGPLADRRFYAFIALCVESWGRFGQMFIDFLKEVAEAAAQRNEALNSMPPDIGAHKQFVARQVRRYMRRISLVRVRGMAQRIQGAIYGVARNRFAAAGMAARLDNGEGQQLALGDSSAAAGMAARLDNGEGQQLALGDSSVDIA